MRRKKVVSIKYRDGDSITITVESKSSDLTRGEADKLVNHLASQSMISMTGAPYRNVDLSRIKVK